MTTRLLLCEGPEDLVAVREIAMRFCGAKAIPGDRQAAGGGATRLISLGTRRGSILRVVAVPDAKSALPRAAANELAIRPPFAGDRSTTRLGSLAVLFDPDGDATSVFHSAMNDAFAKHSPEWRLQPIALQSRAGAAWLARRHPGERLLVRAIAWRADGGVLDGLRDEQNLERVMCRILAAAYPADVDLVAGWLREITRRREGPVPKWKAAVHLWSALVDDKANEHTAPARFLGQHPACAPHVEAVLEETGLLREFRQFAS